MGSKAAASVTASSTCGRRKARGGSAAVIAALLLTGAALYFTYKAGLNDLDDSGTGLIVLALGWPPALWALATGDLDPQRAEMVRDTVRERLLIGRIIAGVGLMACLFAGIAADLSFIAAMAGSVAFTLLLISVWLAGRLWSARAEVN